MEYHFRRVVTQIDGNVVAIVELQWDPKICPECNDHHYEVNFGHGFINLKSWKFNKVENIIQ